MKKSEYTGADHLLRGIKTLVVSLLILITTPAPSQDIQWEKIGGAYGGAINTVQSAKNGLVFAGTKGYGIYFSSDGGKTWTDRGNRDLSSTSITDMAISQSGEIYAISTTLSSLYKSGDDGITWTNVFEFDWHHATQSVAVDSLDNIYVGTYGGGVFISTDGGREWTQPNDLADSWVETIEVAPDGVVFVGTDKGLYRSENTGVGWEWVGPIADAWVYDVAFRGSTEVFVAGTFGLYRSTDNGMTWRLTTERYGLITCSSVLVIPGATIIAGTPIGIIRSTDNGDTWTLNTAGLEDFQIEELTTTNDGKILAATQAYGIYSSEDDGQSWQSSSLGLEATNIYTLAATASGKYFAGTNECVYLSTDYGQTWTRQTSAGNYIRFQAIRISPGGTVFAGAYNGGVLRSRDEMQMWGWVNSGLPWVSSSGNRLYTALSLEIDANNNLYAGTMQGLYRSTDEGESWSRVGPTTAQVIALAPIVNGNIVFSTQGGVFRSTDWGSNWVMIRDTLSLVFFALGSSQTGHVFGSAYNSSSRRYDIFRLSDSGANWNPLSAGFYGPALTFVTTTEGYIIAGGDFGVSISSDDGKTWKNVSQGLPTNSNYNLEIWSLYVDKRGYLYAGSNKGIYRTLQPITSVSSPKEFPPNTFALHQNYPNPFNPSTLIEYEIRSRGDVTLKVLDLLGREVETLVNEPKEPGRHAVWWHGRNNNGMPVSAGVYFYTIQIDKGAATRKMIMVK